MAAMRLVAACFGAVALALRGSHKRDEVEDRPVSKVIAVLQDLQKTLEKEQEEDQSTYNKMACQCSSGTKELEHSIEVANNSIDMLSREVADLVTEVAGLEAEITNLESQVNDSSRTLAEDLAERARETELFRNHTSSTLETITALKSSIVVLNKHHESFLQRPSPPLARTAAVVRTQLQRDAEVLSGVLTPSQRETLRTFVAAELGESPNTPLPKYDVKSKEIFGILQQLLEEFQANLAALEKEEDYKQSTFTSVHGVKTKENTATKDQLVEKRSKILAKNTTAAEKREDVVQTQASKDADTRSLELLGEGCKLTDEQWEDRQAERENEMAAVAEAIQILAVDDAHDTFTRTFKPSFFQVAANGPSDVRERAAMILSRAARRVNSSALSALAKQTKVMDFTDVIEAIDGMVVTLRSETGNEVQKKDDCIVLLEDLELETKNKEDAKDRVLGTIRNLELDIEDFKAEIADLEKAIEDLESDKKKEGELRELQRQDFATTVADQQKTQGLLQNAKEALTKYYNSASLSLAQKQVRQNATSAALRQVPGGFGDYEENQLGHGIIALLDHVIEDAKRMESMANEEEAAQEAAYTALAQATEEDIASKEADIETKKASMATKEQELGEAKNTLTATDAELGTLAQTSVDQHSDCDFLLKNFKLRQTARNEEIDALGQAKATLLGAKIDDV